MAFLRLVPFVLLAACYSPDVRDCVVTCTGAADCAPEQVCGDDGFCASPAAAGTCSTLASTDAGVDAPGDSQPPDAKPDAPPMTTVRLWVRIEGRGEVTIPGIGNCDGGSGQTECQFDVPKGVPTTLHATPKHNWIFEEWGDACKSAQTATCVISPAIDSDVRARFEMLDD